MPERTAELQQILEQIAYDEGYSAAMRYTQEREYKRRKALARRRRERKYFVTQKLVGLAVIIASLAIVPTLDYDITALFITVPLGLLLIFTKKHLLEIMGYEYDENE